jgi:hypothetical protein
MHVIVQDYQTLEYGDEAPQKWNGRIENGDEIENGIGAGTLGVVMTTDKDAYGLTEGHVLAVQANKFTIRHRATRDMVRATAVIKPTVGTMPGFD